MESDEVEVSPKPGTLAWVQAHDLIERGTDMLPSCHRIPADASLMPADASSRCRVVSAAGERCKGTRLLAFGICMGHAGGGGTADLEAMRERSAAKLRSLKVTREILGIGPSSTGSPRAFMRLRAAQRANELALAVVDGPLDDRKLSSIERQRAALAALDATFPVQSASLSISADPEELSWQAMTELAASLLG